MYRRGARGDGRFDIHGIIGGQFHIHDVVGDRFHIHGVVGVRRGHAGERQVDRDHRDAALHAALPDRGEEMDLDDPLDGQLGGDRGEEARPRLVRHRAAATARSAGADAEAMRR